MAQARATREARSEARGNAAFLFLSAIVSGGISGFLGNVLTKVLLGDRPGDAVAWPWIVGLVFAALAVGIALYYWTLLGYGGFAARSPERERYNRLRAALKGGGRIAPVYERMLRRTLDAVDRFFGDADQAERTLFPGAFGLRQRAPLWTAQSYDRCLLIALAYPVAVIVLVWAATAHVGPAETALRLPAGAEGWRRALSVATLALLAFTGLRAEHAKGGWATGWWMVLFAAVGMASVLAVEPGIGALAATGLLIILAAEVQPRYSTGTAAVAAAAAVALAVGSISNNLLSIFASVVVLTGVAEVVKRSAGASEDRGRLGAYLSAWTVLLFLASITAPLWLGDSGRWYGVGAVLLFLVVLSVVNAPFDWITLGLTRALLRRGLELGGWWPLVFGLIDLFVAAAVVIVLAVATLWAVQLFGHFTLIGGGALVLDVARLLEALADPARRTEAEYWWLYAMLFATLIPSIVNVALGALSLMRGVPGLHARLAARMPRGKAVLAADRMWMAPVLTVQTMLSAAIGTAVMLGLMWALLSWALPLAGVNLIPLLQALAQADVPGRLLALLRLPGGA